MKFISFAAFVVLSSASTAQAIELDLPVDCVIGKECFIQNYVDMSDTKKRSDYKCKHLSYDGHKGTDFRLIDIPPMEKGVNVIAAADGKVYAVRTGEPDIHYKENPAYDSRKGLGNTVVIDHADGYRTSYGHMKKGSIHLKKGASVKKGDVIGQIGLSGLTEFPHVHFSVQKDLKHIDPFLSRRMESGCDGGTNLQKSIWSKKALKQLTYEPTTLLNAGVSGTTPNRLDAQKGKYPRNLERDAPTLIIWSIIMGTYKNQQIETIIHFPNNKTRTLKSTVHKNYPVGIYYAGIKRTTPEWPAGIYNVEITLKQPINGDALEKSFSFEVE